MAKKRNVWEALVRRLYYKYFSQNILYELQIRARNVILGGGIGAIVDAEKDMHRVYADSYVIPVVAK